MTENIAENAAAVVPASLGEAVATRSAEGQFDTYEAHVVVSRFRKFCFGLGELGFGTSDYFVETFMMMFYPVIMKANPAIIGSALFLPRILDAFTGPLMGHVSDKTRTRWGRRRPYLLFGAPAVGILTFLLFAAPAGLSERALFLYLCLIGTVYYLLYASAYVPYAALGAELAVEYNERTWVQTWKSVIAAGAVLASALTWRLARLPIFENERSGVLWVVALFGVLIVLAIWASFWGTREQAENQKTGTLNMFRACKETFGNRGFLLLASACVIIIATFFCGFSLGTFVGIYYVFGGSNRDAASTMMVYGSIVTWVMGIGGSLFWGWAGVRIGKDRAFLISLAAVFLVAPLSLVLFTPVHPYWQLAFIGLTQLAFGSWLIIPSAMMADICDADEFKTGCRREGAYSGVMGLLMKTAAALALMMNGVILKMTGFQEKLEVQPVECIDRLRLLYAIIPMVTIGLSIALMFFYPLRENVVRDIRRVLDERHQRAPA